MTVHGCPRSRGAALGLVLVVSGIAAAATAEPDRRTFARVVHRAAPPREVSVHLELPAEGERAPAPVALWSGLSLRLLPLGHVDVQRGVFAWSVQLLSEARDAPLQPVGQPAHGVTPDVIAAFHFRNRDNSGPNAPGPLNVNAPGALRVVRHRGLTLEVRVLDLEIVGARPGAVPAFSSLRLLVTAREEDAARRDGGASEE